jgi:two-component system, OmpR family, response regulator
MRILVVEDEMALAQQLKNALNAAGFAVDLSHDGVDAEFLGNSGDYDAAVLDLGLPGRPGLEVLRHWRAHSVSLPVLILTARDAWHERVDGLNAGADDYLGKPFHMEELLARLRAVLHRSHGQADACLRAHGLVLDTQRQEVSAADGSVFALTATEFRLLRYFMLNSGQILSKTQLTEHIYDQDFDKDSNLIEVYLKRLRAKLGRHLFHTRRGQGYVFGDNA